ncbi:hypothetical protein PT974_11434 [Cladobotryum mycophilum]|uniref:Uncharacterized protein n=1 Tax=Cladobotryum mycophilum TaxID=491253 RepID=A0ABR0S570_9HYPO
MAETSETIKRFRNGLELYIKPREQVNYIRRVLALHLGTCSGHDGPIRHPLSLADSSRDVNVPSDMTGTFREYFDALQANIIARRQLDEMLRSNATESVEPPKQNTAGAELLEERICLLKWHQKLESLHAVRQSLDSLMEKPAATPEFLDTKQIFQGTPQPPDVPNEIMDGLVEENADPRSDLTDRIQQLEKTVLRAKLLSKQEEQALRDAKARCKTKHEIVSNGARFEALTATRNELIGWIETELGKAAPGEVGRSHGLGPDRHIPKDGSPTLSARLEEISRKYTKYVSSRKVLLQQGAQKSQPALLAPAHFSISTTSDKPPAPIPTNFLLTQYLNTLITISAKQKAMVGQKAFITSTLGKEGHEVCQMLGHLGEESHLLPLYPMKDSLRRRSGIQHEIAMRSSEQPDISERIKPWVFATYSAKMATLESVAETVEGGQVALENSMSILQDIDVLLGRDEDLDDETSATEEPSEDGWPETRTNKLASRRSTEKKQKNSQKENDVWSRLHGNLGLLGQG